MIDYSIVNCPPKINGDITNYASTLISESQYMAAITSADVALTKTYTDMYHEILDRLSALEKSTPEYTELKCRECGGTIEQKYEDHIVKCPYCKTVYAIGRKYING